MLLHLAKHYILQLAVTVGIIVLTGVTVAGAKRLFLKCCGRGAYCMEMATGLIGTPVHELSHAFFCLIFGHRITGICLWNPRSPNGNLGYVTHTYRKRNLWHQIGNFFIGVAPILGGSSILLLLLWLLLPESSAALFASLGNFPSEAEEIPSALLRQTGSVLKALFLPENFLRWHWYLYLFLAILIVLHMEISRSDLGSGLLGLLFISLLLLSADAVLLFVYPEGLLTVTHTAVWIGAFLSSFFCLAVILAAILLLISLAVLAVRRR